MSVSKLSMLYCCLLESTSLYEFPHSCAFYLQRERSSNDISLSGFPSIVVYLYLGGLYKYISFLPLNLF